MADIQIKAAPRQALRKKARFLRREGLLPGNVYGQGEPSLEVQVSTQELSDLLRHGARNQLLDLVIEGESAQGGSQSVVIRDVHRDPVSRRYLHVDFLRVSLTETMTATVPLTFVGESAAVKDLGGVFVQSLNAVTVSALPSDVPQHIEVDLAFFQELDATLHVSDLAAPPNTQFVTDGATLVAKVALPKLRAEDEEVVAEEAAAEEAAEQPAAGAPEPAGAEASED